MTNEGARAAAGLAPGQRIADHPERQEVVTISYQDLLTGRARLWSAFIHRHGDEVWLGEFTEAGLVGGGLMVGLFDKPGDYRRTSTPGDEIEHE